MEKPEETALAAPNPSALTDWSPAEFTTALANESAKRTALEGYIKGHLKDGVDFGTIPFGPNRQSKPCLFKPGAEKVASLLKLRPSFRADADVLKMLGEVGTGVVAFVCTLATGAGEVVAEGRGSCGPEKQDLNTRIKIAEKRAMLDAVLRVAALSDHFTQDTDDLDPPAGTPGHVAPATRPAPRPTSSPPAAAPSAGVSRTPVKTGLVLKFGKHSGKDLGECPTDYLVWMRKNPLDENHEKFGETNARMNKAVIAVLEERSRKAPQKSLLPDERVVEGDIVDQQIQQAREDAGPEEPPGDLPLDQIPF